MSVKVNIDSGFWGGVGGKARVFEVQGKTVRECLKKVVEKEPSLRTTMFDKNGEVSELYFITINLAPLQPRTLERKVKDGDVIGIVFGGGG